MTTHFRKHTRLCGFDYRENRAYFVTMVTADRQCIFGSIENGLLRPTQRGLIARRVWSDLPNHHPFVELDAFIVMPNHVHGIICIVGNDPEPARVTGRLVSRSIGAVVGSYKSAVTRSVNQLRSATAARLWQPNFYEHIIRNNRAFEQIREYIVSNPSRWNDDSENLAGTRTENVESFTRSLLVEQSKDPQKGDAGVAAT